MDEDSPSQDYEPFFDSDPESTDGRFGAGLLPYFFSPAENGGAWVRGLYKQPLYVPRPRGSCILVLRERSL